MFAHSELLQEMPKLQKFAYKLCKTPDQADDLLQATLMKSLEKKEMFEEGTNLFGWTGKIMYNTFINDYNRKVKFESQCDPYDYIKMQKSAPRQEQQLALKNAKEAIDKLSDKHRTILIMVSIKGMKYEQVSDALDIPVGTVRSRLSRAREQLQTQLGGENTIISTCANDESPMVFRSAS